MTQETKGPSSSKESGEGVIGAVAAGLTLVVLGAVFVLNQDIFTRIVDFFGSLTVVPITNTSINLLVPISPAAHTEVYYAAFQFAVGIAILQVLILGIRFAVKSQIHRIAETVGNLVFWFGAAIMLSSLSSMSSTLDHSVQIEMWFQFWSIIIMLIGGGLITRAAILIAAKRL